jgi:hypothetical protein
MTDKIAADSRRVERVRHELGDGAIARRQDDGMGVLTQCVQGRGRWHWHGATDFLNDHRMSKSSTTSREVLGKRRLAWELRQSMLRSGLEAGRETAIFRTPSSAARGGPIPADPAGASMTERA